MGWRKLGLLFSADGQHPWMVSHAANPTAEILGAGRIRVYFGTRDRMNRSHVASAVFELSPSPRLIHLEPEPLVEPGPPGAFDDSGASMGCLVVTEKGHQLYYLGWNLGVTVPWRNSIGLATSSDGGRSFKKVSVAPIMDRNSADPFTLSYPWILRTGGLWRMWYGSNLRWGSEKHDMDHVIKYAESDDGLAWRRDGKAVLPLSGPGEFALARPCVLQDGVTYRMWFTHRGDRYRLGYAESVDGVTWRRDPLPDVPEASPSGWDAEMVTYPCVFDLEGARYMLYSGNGYGRAGFGLAIAE
jgi:hypothetical protein